MSFISPATSPLASLKGGLQPYALSQTAPANKTSQLCAIVLKHFGESCYQALEDALPPECGTVFLGCTSYNKEAFSKLVQLILKTPAVQLVRLKTTHLTGEQLEQLKQLTGSNERKGLRIEDLDGKKLDYVLDPAGYIEAKSERINYVANMRETTRCGLEVYEKLHGCKPELTIDFGAGTGACTIALALKGCSKILAVDADEDSLDILKKNLQEELTKASLLVSVDCITSPFIKTKLPEAGLFIASFTFPYRTPKDFPDMWEKTISCVKQGGVIAGHLYTEPLNPSPGCTYHTKEEAEALLEKNFTVKWIEEQTSGFVIYNGDDVGGTTTDDDPAKREWGHLIHFVAVKK